MGAQNQVGFSPGPFPRPAPSQTPGGFLMLQAGAAQNVTAANAHLRVKLQVTIPPVVGEKTVHILLTDYQFAVLKDETRAVPPGASGSWNTSIEFPPQARDRPPHLFALSRNGEVGWRLVRVRSAECGMRSGNRGRGRLSGDQRTRVL